MSDSNHSSNINYCVLRCRSPHITYYSQSSVFVSNLVSLIIDMYMLGMYDKACTSYKRAKSFCLRYHEGSHSYSYPQGEISMFT